MRVIVLGGGLAVGTAAIGCAGLEARKVPLDDRLTCRDGHVHGFRYYLSRPYLVVGERLDVVSTYQPARVRIVAGPGPDRKPVVDPCGAVHTVLEAIDAGGCRRLYDMAGRPLPEELQAQSLVPVQAQSAAPQAAPGVRSQPPQLLSIAGGVGQPPPPAVPNPATGFPAPGAATQAPPGGSTQPQGADGRAAAGVVVNVCCEKPAAAAGGGGPRPDALSITYLPDFEEQMAVRSKNTLAQTKFKLQFRDGWALNSVEGNHDSTAVPIQILNTIRSAISAAGALEEKRLGLIAPAPSSASPATADDANKARAALDAAAPKMTVRIIRTAYIEPGMYRLRKSSEMGGPPQGGLGLLADLGIPVQEEVRVERIVGE